MTSFGASLRRERELRGVSLQEIAAATKIGVRMLEAIEEDRLDKLPQGLFVRGFVREYARFLALDEQKILTELSFHATPATVVIDNEVGERGRRVSSRLATRLINGGLATGVLAVVAVLILSPGFSGENVAPTALPAVDAPAASSIPESATSAGAPAQSINAASVLPGAATAPSVLPQPLQLTLTATEDCWIGLDVGGDRVENRVLKKGESFSITARQNASLAVGNAGGLLVAIDSGPPRPLGNRGEVKRNIPLSPEAIGALSALSSGPDVVPTKPIG
jgi:cytoskeleton protein RodZ